MSNYRRRPKRMAGLRTGRFSKSRIAWMNPEQMEVVLYESRHGDDGYEAFYEDLPDFYLSIKKTGKAPTTIRLSNFTTEELDLLGEFFQLAIEKARPNCIERDARAKKEFEDGDDSQFRLYRDVPKIFERPRSERPDDQGIPE